MDRTLENALLSRLEEIEEIALSGFGVRQGLTGSGVTVLQGHTYFGIWRASEGSFGWMSSHSSEPFFAHSVDEAARHTLLLILRSLQDRRGRPAPQRLVG